MINTIEYRNISHVLLDIEGTTCPVSFVAQTLFPYASQELLIYLQAHKSDPGIAGLIEELEKLWQEDTNQEARQLRQTRKPSPADCIEALIPYLQYLIRADRKATALKDLQGKIWESGYSKGELIAPLFEDVPGRLSEWKEQGQCLAVYSSGSIAAQKLLYGYSNAGDLRALFSHWFDTRTGLKQSPESYSLIGRHMQCDPRNILFISDSASELDAAQQAGLQVLLSQRDEIHPPQSPYQAIRSFHQVLLHHFGRPLSS